MFINYNLKETASTELRIITNEKKQGHSHPIQSNPIQSYSIHGWIQSMSNSGLAAWSMSSIANPHCWSVFSAFMTKNEWISIATFLFLCRPEFLVSAAELSTSWRARAWVDGDVILSTIVTTAILEVYYVATAKPSLHQRLLAKRLCPEIYSTWNTRLQITSA